VIYRRYEIRRTLVGVLPNILLFMTEKATSLGYTAETFVLFPKQNPVLVIVAWKENGKIIAAISDLESQWSGFYFPDIIYIGSKRVIAEIQAAILEYDNDFPKPIYDEATNLRELITLELPENLSPLNLVN
jgi:hypothetical protein